MVIRNSSLVSAVVTLFVCGCAQQPFVDPDARRISGHVVAKTESISSDEDVIYEYGVDTQSGGSLKATSKYPGYDIGQCVSVIVSEKHSNRITSAQGCTPIERDVFDVLVVKGIALPKYSLSPSLATGRSVGFQKGAASGAAAGAVAPLESELILLYPIIAPITIGIGAIVGGVYGVTTAVPDTTAEAMEKALKEVASKHDVENIFKNHFVKTANKLSTHEAQILNEIPFAFHNDEVESGQQTSALLNIRISDIGFSGGKGVDPSTRLIIKAHVKLTQRQTGKLMFSDNFLHSSEERELSEWMENTSEALNEELLRGCRELSEEVADRLLSAMFEYWAGR
jgi:hypothetical protein